MLNETKYTLDIESTYPLIAGEDEIHLNEEKAGGNVAPRWTIISKDANVWRTLFFGLLSLNLLYGLIHIINNSDSGGSLLKSQGLFPRFSTHILTFREDHRFDVDPFDGEVNVWDDLIPLGRGHIAVQNPASWNLSGGYPLDDELNPEAEGYSIAVFHQIHCLAAIKSQFLRLSSANTTNSSPSSQPHSHAHTNTKPQPHKQGHTQSHSLLETHTLPQLQTHKHLPSNNHQKRKISTPAEHLDHCFDYLRQSLMCTGDTTLEKAALDYDGRQIRIIEGWDVEHQCRDFGAIHAFAEKNHAHDEREID
jgi:hypothetical protein